MNEDIVRVVEGDGIGHPQKRLFAGDGGQPFLMLRIELLPEDFLGLGDSFNAAQIRENVHSFFVLQHKILL